MQSSFAMKRIRRSISFLLLFVFALLVFKNLNLPNESLSQEDCQEFGHIHNYSLKKIAQNSGSQSNTVSKLSPSTKNDLECREGKAVFGYSLKPASVVILEPQRFELNFAMVFTIKNNFKDLTLEPQKRPPRLA